MMFLLKIGIFILNIIYMFIKIFPTRHKITFISRESNYPSIDFILLKNELKRQDNNLEIVILCKKIDKGIINKIKYIFHMFKQMYHIATSKVVILDTYCITISVLKHKKNLKVIQMWHAMGSLKKFGYSIIDQKEGSSKKLAQTMRMHKNYDYVFASCEESVKYFSQAFNVDENKVKIMPLPRIDIIKNIKNINEIKKRILNTYPNINKKKIILYAPTFRKNKKMIKAINNLKEKIDFEKYNLVIKLHPNDNTIIDDDIIIQDKEFTTLELSCISDYIITDYSAIVFELALLNKPMFFYTYDIKNYINERNFYIDYYNTMPGVISSDAGKIINSIEHQEYDLTKVKDFANLYIKPIKGSYSKEISKFIIKLLQM